MKKYLFLFLISLLAACKNDKEVANEPTEVFVEIPEDFLDFYEKFHSDSVFQVNHTLFPLKEKSDGSYWQKAEWRMHQAFDSQNGSYTREFDNFNGILIETILEKNGAFMIKRRFAKFGDSYNLIYYSIDNQLERWGQKILDDSLGVSQDSIPNKTEAQ